MKTSHSVWNIVDLISLYKTELIFVLRDKLLLGTKPGFLKSEKGVIALGQWSYFNLRSGMLNRTSAIYVADGNTCPVVITSTTQHPPPYSGYSICHLAITSANTLY